MIWKCEQCPDEAETLNEVNAHEQTSGHTMRRQPQHGRCPDCGADMVMGSPTSNAPGELWCSNSEHDDWVRETRIRAEMAARLKKVTKPAYRSHAEEIAAALAERDDQGDGFAHLPAWGSSPTYDHHGPDK